MDGRDTMMAGPATQRAARALPRRWLIHLGAAFILALNCTDTDAAFGMLAGFPQLRFVSIFFGACLLAYLCFFFPLVRSLLRNRLVAWWLAILAWVPAILICIQWTVGMYDLEGAIYYFGLVITNGLLFLTAAQLAYKKMNIYILRLIISVSILISAIGFIFQYLDYGFIRSTMIYSSNVIANSSSIVRLLGFYSHPNYAAFSLLCLVTTYILTSPVGSKLLTKNISIYLLLIVIVLLTGSRTSLFLAIFSFSIYATFAIRHGNTGLNLGVALATAAVLVPVVMILLPAIQSMDGALSNGLERLLKLLGQFDVNSDVDQSASLRAGILGPYFNISFRSPLLGYGYQWLQQHIGSTDLPISSQNTWIQWAVQFGYPYMLTAGALFFSTIAAFYRYGSMPKGEPFRYASMNFMLIVLLATFSINDIFLMKSVLIIFGMLLGRLARLESSTEEKLPVGRRALRTPSLSDFTV